jgi:hypothetical protein
MIQRRFAVSILDKTQPCIEGQRKAVGLLTNTNALIRLRLTPHPLPLPSKGRGEG